MFRPSKRFLATLIAVGVAACADAPSAARSPADAHGLARLGFEPVFSAAAKAAAAHLSDFGITFDHVRVVIVRPVADTVKDTTIAFAPGQPDVTLAFDIPVLTPGETFHATLDFINTSGVVFRGDGSVQSHAPDEPAPAQQITVQYVGPGATVTRVAVSPTTTSVIVPATVTFTATGFDDGGAPVPGTPFSWSTSDPTLATISSSGTLTPTGKRGTVQVTATTPTNVTATASLAISLPPSGIVLVSGGGQSGQAGAALAQPGVVKVTASDGVGVGGVAVNFAAPTGGKVGASTVTTDASGVASTSLTLGGAIGPQSFVASALGFSVSIPATAKVGDATTVAVVSGGVQSDTVTHALKLPLVVKVTDQFGNAASGVTVNWARTAGSGTLSGATSVSAADGLTSIRYTLGAKAGPETITASVAGGGTVSFTATAVADVPAAIAVVSGNGQTGRISQVLSPFVVKVTDAHGNAVSGVTVAWKATNGTLSATTTTDTSGKSSNTMTVGIAAGRAGATATVAGKVASFSVTVQTGVVTKIVFLTGPPTSAPAGAPIAPAIRVALQDAGGNLTAATNAVSITLGRNPGESTLRGTLTRNAVAGVATFNDLTLNRIAAGYTLVVSSAGVADLTSEPFAVVPGAPGNLAIVAGDAQTGAVLTAAAVAPSVRLTDTLGNVIPQASVTFAPAEGSGSVEPAGAISTDQAGRATLTSWTFGAIAGPQTLVASSPGVPSVTFHATVVPGVPAKLGFLVNPTSVLAGAPFTPPIQVAIQDASGNVVTTTNDPIALEITSGTGTADAVLSGTAKAPAVYGIATFSEVGISLPGSNYTLTATTEGLSSAVSAAFNILAQPPALASVTPASVDAVFATLPVALTGVDFVPGATTVTVSGGNVTTANTVVQNATALTTTFNIAGGAQTVAESVRVTTVQGTSNALPFTLYSVGAAPLQLGPAYGGAGGQSYSLDCPAGAVGTGLEVHGGTNVDQIQVICQAVSGSGRTFGSPSLTNAAGQPGGSQATLSCPANHVLTGLTGRIGNGGSGLNDQIAGICAPINGGSTVTTSSVGSNQPNSIAYSASCPAGLALTGIQGGAGNLIDRTQIKCK